MIGRKASLALLALVAAASFALMLHPDGRAAFSAAVAWLRDAGWAGRAASVGLVVVAIPLGFPTLLLAAMIGYLYGPALGVAIAWPSTVLGATLAFALARAFLGQERLTALRPRWPAVAALRLAAPHNLLNLTLPASALTLGAFVLGTAIGSLPSVTLASLGGAFAPDAAALFR